MSNSGNHKVTQDVWSFQTDLFQKAPDQKSSNDAPVLIKCWFYKQAPQKVLIKLSLGVNGYQELQKWFEIVVFKIGFFNIYFIFKYWIF